MAASGLALPVGGSTTEGRRVAAEARVLLLDYVIFPYNRLLGLRRKKDTTLGLAREAEIAFRSWLETRTKKSDIVIESKNVYNKILLQQDLYGK